MNYMLYFILAGTAFLAVLALIVFAVLVVSIHRAPRVPLPEIHGRRSGTIARRVLAGFSAEDKDDAE